MAPWEAAQIALGLTIPLLVAAHVAATRGLNLFHGVDDVYTVQLRLLWPGAALKQSVLRVIYGGLPAQNGYAPMVAIGQSMTNEQVKDVTDYIRNSWGNKAPVMNSGSAVSEAKAATQTLLSGRAPAEVTIDLPAGRPATFVLHRVEQSDGRVLASIIKDAGDDPDVTHGAEIQATVERGDAPGITLAGGTGVVGLKLLGAIFGEDAVRRMAEQARSDLVNRIDGLLDEAMEAFRARLPPRFRAGLSSGAGSARTP